ERRGGQREGGRLGREMAAAAVRKACQRADRAPTMDEAVRERCHVRAERRDGAQAGHRHLPHAASYGWRSATMKSTSDRTDAKARVPPPSSAVDTRKRSSTRTTSSSASIESSPRPSPKMGESSGMSPGGRSSRSPVTRSCFTSAASASRSIARSLEHRETAVHVEGGPGQVRGCRRGKKENGTGDLVRIRETAERNLALAIPALRLGHLVDQSRVDEAGRDGVHGDGVASGLARERLGKGDDARLCR